jgi:asparagine synthase (glutamine-hydrolysing)
MCGIAGFIGSGDRNDLHRMTRALARRGPDGEGFYEDERHRIALGHRRLSVVDLEGGRQPMSTIDRMLWVVFNGEIYNHHELRSELEQAGHIFASDHSDTEVLLHGYREWGTGMVDRLNGMWAFAIFDARRQRLFLSRDRFGQKPLYWARRPGCFAFSSQLDSLRLHTRIDSSISASATRKLFAYGWIPAPNSLYEGISKLPGGHNLIVDVKTLEAKVERYWRFELDAPKTVSATDEARLVEELQVRLSQAVSRRLIADVPVGVFLSGGLDSSTIAALACDEKPGSDVRTFSIGFEDKSFDESRYASQVASNLGTRHESRIFSLDHAREMLPSVIDALDEPFGDASILPTALLCREAKKHVTVALGGDGADELFAGYDPFRALRWADAYRRVVPKPLHHGLRLLAARLPTSIRNMSLDFRIKRTLRGLDHQPQLWNPVWLGPLEPREMKELFEAPIEIEEVYSEAIEIWDECRSSSLVDQTLQFYTQMYLQDDILMKADRASMMNGLELRSPFLDIDLVNLVRRIPTDLKLRGSRTKHLLREATSARLPQEILNRAKKGFGMPTARWFREGELAFPAWPSGEASAPEAGRFFDRQLQAHRAGRADHRLYLFTQWVWDRHQGAAALADRSNFELDRNDAFAETQPGGARA